jgi:hypothetical protein
MNYLFDDYGRFAGTSDAATERSTTVEPHELTSDYNWNDYAWVYVPNINTSQAIVISNPPELISERKISTIDFKLRFTAQERVAIYASTDDFVIDFRQLLDDPRLQNVDVLLPTTIDAIDYLISLNLIDSNRKDEILA